MERLKRNRDPREVVWKVCLQCGNRFEAASHGYRVNWCSPACEDASFKRQREEIESTWLRARWFLR
jgi:predicted  nucleic acid-binding Zn-ribbon protein